MDEDQLKDFIKKEAKKVIEEAMPPKMNDTEKSEYARENRRITHQNYVFAEGRSSSIADEFIRLQVQIAVLLFGFSGLFVNTFTTANLNGFEPIGLFLMKIAFAISLFALLASLSFGLFHLKSKEKFWDNNLSKRIIRFREWSKVVRKETDVTEADAYQRGTGLEQGNTVSVPSWAWKLQSIFLAGAVIILYVLSVIYLFAQSDSTRIIGL